MLLAVFVYWVRIDGYIKSMVGSSGKQRVQTDVVSNLSINLPPLETQQQIAALLSSLDDKIELNNRINDKLLIFSAYIQEFASKNLE